jgi:hypothetical protein
VDLRVILRSDGTVTVLGIVSGLPGLNDSAATLAKGIKFVPALENGCPMDFTTTIHVRYQLSE